MPLRSWAPCVLMFAVGCATSGDAPPRHARKPHAAPTDAEDDDAPTNDEHAAAPAPAPEPPEPGEPAKAGKAAKPAKALPPPKAKVEPSEN